MTKNSVCIVIPKIIKVEHICKVIVKKEGCNFYGPQCITEKYVMQILWVIQVSWLQWLLVMIGMSLSGAVLVMTVVPAFKNDKKQVKI